MLYTRSVGAWVSAQERDAEVAELQERLAQLRALEQERGLPTPGSSDTPRVHRGPAAHRAAAAPAPRSPPCAPQSPPSCTPVEVIWPQQQS